MTCTIDGCEREARCRGMCDTHYRRWKRHGDASVVLKPPGRPPGPAAPTCPDCGGKAQPHHECKRCRHCNTPISGRGQFCDRSCHGAYAASRRTCPECGAMCGKKLCQECAAKRRSVGRVAPDAIRCPCGAVVVADPNGLDPAVIAAAKTNHDHYCEKEKAA